MADPVVLGFEDVATAQKVYEVGAQLRREELIDLEDAALAWRDETGRVRIQQAMPTTSAGAAGGALWGTLIGMLFLVPVAGLAVGAATGAIAGKLTDIGIDDELIKRITAQLEPGRGAVFALVRRSTPDRVTEALKEYKPTVLHTNLSHDRQEELVRALQAA
jgi:uncharacterized membrane protein